MDFAKYRGLPFGVGGTTGSGTAAAGEIYSLRKYFAGGGVAALRGTKVFCRILNPTRILALTFHFRFKLATGPEN